MGKLKKNNKKVKNIFKVAGARSLKLKNKAKALSVQLKKVSHDGILWNIRAVFFVFRHHLFCLFLLFFLLLLFLEGIGFFSLPSLCSLTLHPHVFNMIIYE